MTSPQRKFKFNHNSSEAVEQGGYIALSLRCPRAAAGRSRVAIATSLAFATVGALLGPLAATCAATSAAPVVPSVTTTASATSAPAYYLFESNGVVLSCGAAPLYGSEAGKKLPAPIVAGAATTSGTGYWLVSSKGRIYPFGSARALGSPVHLRLSSPISAFATTSDGRGYWLVTAGGNLFHYGDAGFFGSTAHDRTTSSVAAIVPTTSGRGYWIVLANRVVPHFGNAAALGSLAHPRRAVVAAAADPAGSGLWLLTADGGVHNLGHAGFYSSAVHQHLARPATALSSSADGAGYLVAAAFGGVYNFGDAVFDGSLAASPPRRPTAVVAISTVLLPPPAPVVVLPPVPSPTGAAPASNLPHGAFGYDISNYQCAALASSSLPTTSAISTIEVAGWLDGSDNPCLAGEAAWATTAAGASGAHYGLNIFLNAPDESAGATALDASGPGGTCATLSGAAQAGCLAYNYGYEGATADYDYASSVGVVAPLWWLDVENASLSSTQWSDYAAGKYWSDSTALNADTIEGALDALRAFGLMVGIYSSSVQFPLIAGAYVPSGAPVPLWVAGAPWTNPPYTESGLLSATVLPSWCAGTSGYSSTDPTDLFAGGVPWLLQETPGSEASPDGIDPDYAC